MSANTKEVNVSFGGLWVLGFLFVILKVAGVIEWSWLWVLAPFWIPWGIVLGFTGVVLIFTIAVLLVVGVVSLISEVWP